MKRLLATCVALLIAPAAAVAEPSADVHMIWDHAPHNAFTDLVRFKGQWFCTFREGTGHVSHDGKARVLVSKDGDTWGSAALISAPGELPDLRDPKITITPDGKLMLTTAAADRRTKPAHHQSYAWFSDDGRTWSDATPIGDANFWLWRVTWHKGVAYAIGYGTGAADPFIRLYASRDGRTFDTLVPKLFDQGYPNETSMVFTDDDTCYCLLRRDEGSATAQLGIARPPYKEWTWKDLGVRVGGPKLIQLPDGRFVAAGRRYDGGARTSLMWLDTTSGGGKLTEFLKLPSGGDTSYPGLVFHDGTLWVSYYSSHEGKTKIYLAKVKLPEG
jgi:hypothetical protein